MKFAVSSNGTNLNSMVGSCFQHSKYLLLVDPETLEYVVMINPLKWLHGPAEGRMLAQVLKQEKAEKVITGKCGWSLSKSLGDAGIQVVTDMGGAIRDVLEQCKSISLADTHILSTRDLLYLDE